VGKRNLRVSRDGGDVSGTLENNAKAIYRTYAT